MRKFLFLYLLLFLAFCPNIAQAYIGPGLGAGALSLILGIIFTVFLAVFGIVYYPIKKLVLKIKKTVKK